MNHAAARQSCLQSRLFQLALVLCVGLLVASLILFNPFAACNCPVQSQQQQQQQHTTVVPCEKVAPLPRVPLIASRAAKEQASRRWRESRPAGEQGVEPLQQLLGQLAELDKVTNENDYRPVIDIGGNVGQTSSRLMREIVRKRPDYFRLFTFEPMKAYDTIVARARQENWTSFVLFQCAVGIRPGSVTFYFDSDTSEQSSQDAEASGTALHRRNVSIISMDQFLYDDGIPSGIVRTSANVSRDLMVNGTYGAHNIFFYKIDTEGYDMDVLHGSRRLLTSKRARFIEFEYNGKWFSVHRTRTLKQVAAELYDVFGYECYFISAKYLHPIFGDWWRDEMEMRAWSNVLCGQRDDFYLHWIVRRFDHQDFKPLAPIDYIQF